MKDSGSKHVGAEAQLVPVPLRCQPPEYPGGSAYNGFQLAVQQSQGQWPATTAESLQFVYASQCHQT